MRSDLSRPINAQARTGRGCDQISEAHLVAGAAFDDRNFRCQPFYFLVQVLHLSSEFVHVISGCILSIRTIQQRTHGVSRDVRYASSAGDQTKPSERRVLLIGEPDADHAGSRFQDCHLGFRCLFGDSGLACR